MSVEELELFLEGEEEEAGEGVPDAHEGPASITVDLGAHGYIQYFVHDHRCQATCLNDAHMAFGHRCRLTRSSRRREHSSAVNGRPLGFMAAWLRYAFDPGHPTREDHRAPFVSLDDRSCLEG